MVEATQEIIALSREICAEHCSDSKIGKIDADEFRKGRCDKDTEMLIALAAIQATTERAAKLADGWNAKRRDRATETSIAAALRDGDHLKEQSA